MSDEVTVVHKGSCHCGAVQWEVDAPEVVDICRCNCSVCTKKRNDHVIVDADCFRLLKGADAITVYKFNTGVAQHKFCKFCGVESFYHPRSNPNCIAFMPHCVDSPTIKGEVIHSFNGQEWEKSMAKKRPESFSKE